MIRKIDFREIYHALAADLRALNTLWDTGQNEMGRRVFAVFVFSTFESTGWLLINYVNAAIPGHGRGTITDKRIVSAKSKKSEKIGSVEHINFALRYVASFHGAKDFSASKVPLWEYVQPAIKIRDRIVHPKTIDSMRVTVEEQITCKCALAWLINCMDVLSELEQNPGSSFNDVLQRMTTQQ
jgi:hypothetical protein